MDNEPQGTEQALAKFSDADLLDALTDRLSKNPSIDRATIDKLKTITNDLETRLSPDQTTEVQVPTVIETGVLAPTETAEDPNLSHLRELFSSLPELPYYLQIIGKTGEELLGWKFVSGKNPRVGFREFKFGGSKDRSAYIGPKSTQLFRVLENMMERRAEASIIAVHNISKSAETLIGISYIATRGLDIEDSRRGQQNLMFVVPDEKASDFFQVLKETNFRDALTVIQDAIDPNLNRVTPVPEIKSLAIGSVPEGTVAIQSYDVGMSSYGPKNTEIIPQPPTSPVQ